ncbi:hypothetical protein C2845_PM13G06190 [Panicum miliaceum]|uniref:Alcohol dehydrogenase-like C-terminal domain-containing protein n=1 Tax=Panicum miliaceum TaxID=4540 RepID=A0A3L6RHA9_PANMI|nr:hypothetical protein C2845_PM13G06190 [Panicum miliaceum]
MQARDRRIGHRGGRERGEVQARGPRASAWAAWWTRDSCRSCTAAPAASSLCRGVVWTYNSVDPRDGGAAATYGGYSSAVVVHERFVVRSGRRAAGPGRAAAVRGRHRVQPPEAPRAARAGEARRRGGAGGAGPRRRQVRQGARGGGDAVTVLSSSPAKRREALKRLGADAFVLSSDADEMKAAAGTMDGIINTVSANIPLTPLLSLLKPNGKMVLVGMPEKPLEIPPFDLILGKMLAAS